MRYTHVVVHTEDAEGAFKVVTSNTFEMYYRGRVKAPKWGSYEECLAFVKSA